MPRFQKNRSFARKITVKIFQVLNLLQVFFICKYWETNESNLPSLLYTIRKVQRGVNCFGVKSKIGQVVQKVCIGCETVKNEWDQFQEVMGLVLGALRTC